MKYLVHRSTNPTNCSVVIYFPEGALNGWGKSKLVPLLGSIFTRVFNVRINLSLDPYSMKGQVDAISFGVSDEVFSSIEYKIGYQYFKEDQEGMASDMFDAMVYFTSVNYQQLHLFSYSLEDIKNLAFFNEGWLKAHRMNVGSWGNASDEDIMEAYYQALNRYWNTFSPINNYTVRLIMKHTLWHNIDWKVNAPIPFEVAARILRNTKGYYSEEYILAVTGSYVSEISWETFQKALLIPVEVGKCLHCTDTFGNFTYEDVVEEQFTRFSGNLNGKDVQFEICQCCIEEYYDRLFKN